MTVKFHLKECHMPSFSARIVGFILRKSGVYRRMFAGGPQMLEAIAKVRAKPIDAPSAKMRARLDISTHDFQGRTVWHIAPKGHTTPIRLLYFHGGGYVYSAMKGHWDFYAHLAETYGIAIIAPLYPLAPEADAAETTAFALALYQELLTKHAAEHIVFGGDSAGGGLAAATLMGARDAGVPLPARAVLICPWLEANPAHPDQIMIEKRDAILTRQGIADAGRLYAGSLSLTDPRVSPIHGRWDRLPPILMYGGGDDILVTDARALRAKLPSVMYEEVAGMIHDWPIFVFPESRTAQERIAAFVGP
jgi:epsilon-lactone hydrolase